MPGKPPRQFVSFDWAMKKLLRSKANFDILEGFLSELLKEDVTIDYALKQVNVREGWQIFSDIGHSVGVTWEGQNKRCSPTHARTLSLATRERFFWFCHHYQSCLREFENRTGKKAHWESLRDKVSHDTLSLINTRLPVDEEDAYLRLLTTVKSDQLTPADHFRLRRHEIITENHKHGNA